VIIPAEFSLGTSSIRIVRRQPDGTEIVITAATGTMTQGFKQGIEVPSVNAKDQDRLKVLVIQSTLKKILFKVTLQNISQSGTTRMITQHGVRYLHIQGGFADG